MKKDNLERFVRDNREAFDGKEPPGDLWFKLAMKLDQQTPELTRPGHNESPFTQIHRNQPEAANRKKGPAGWSWSGLNWSGLVLDWRVAASVTVLLLAGCFLYMNQQYGVTKQPEVLAASPSYAKEVVQYMRSIDDKRVVLKQMTEGNPALYQEFATDLDRLEKSYQLLKADLPKNPNQEVLIQAMIQNLQFQINLLNEQLRVIQRIKQQTHETTPI